MIFCQAADGFARQSSIAEDAKWVKKERPKKKGEVSYPITELAP